MSSSEAYLPLKGKTAIVTGASRGLGAGMAYELAKRGADVILTYTSPSSSTLISSLSSKTSLLPHKPSTHSVMADLTKVDSPDEIVRSIKDWRGGDLKIDILVNNAGAELNKKLGEITAQDFAHVYDLNVRGTLLMTQAVLPYLQPHSRIINIGSVASRTGFAGFSIYASSKAAIEGLTRVWAVELGGNGTTVNTVNPGPVDSDMLKNVPKEIVEKQRAETPVEKRLGTTEEVADIVAWLAGKDSRWVTGQTISASGGWALY
ncbi:Dehydrogenase [Lachnellula occidentalis]|uniref:Dehydrogenase n=1 Tax=Lachnellula occidentalis TaxID=215460 RepID=A0A8H8RV62_9HELO|nr:Dehydrogenase [Lachnellula occidentalis]